MATLENKNVNPVVAVIANGFVLGILGYALIGQTNKGIMVLLATLIGTLLCGLPGIIVMILGLVDVFEVATAIQKGEKIDEHEYKNEMLYKIVKMLHKDAIFNG